MNFGDRHHNSQILQVHRNSSADPNLGVMVPVTEIQHDGGRRSL
jgi:hypothetical protein